MTELPLTFVIKDPLISRDMEIDASAVTGAEMETSKAINAIVNFKIAPMNGC